MESKYLRWFFYLTLFAFPVIASGSQPEGRSGNEDVFLIHYWFFGNSIPEATPLVNIPASYGRLSGGILKFQSALAGYPFTPFHPNWRKASMERITAPTPLNYRPEGNFEIPYSSAEMKGIQIKQPFAGNGGENTLIFEVPSKGYKELVFSFAARDGGAADAVRVDYSVTADTTEWITTGLITNVIPLPDNYSLFEINFTEEATQSPPPPPSHGEGDDQIPVATVMLVNDNPNLRIRIRFLGSNMTINENKNVVFNNFSLEGKIAAEDYQVLTIAGGWSGISSFVVPDDALLEKIFYPVMDKLIIMQNFDGFWWPSTGVNNLMNWNDKKGYSIKAQSQMQLVLAGHKQENLTLNLPQGWSYMSVLTPCSQPVSELFSPVINQLVVVKEVAGSRVYWPSMGINSLGVVETGKSYLVMMQSAGSIEFQPCESLTSPLITNFEKPDLRRLPAINRTPNTHLIAVHSDTSTEIKEGNLLTAHGVEGKIYGAAVWQNGNFAVTLYGDDPATPQKDGFSEGEPIIFKIKSSFPESEYLLQANFHPTFPQTEARFVTHGISAISALSFAGGSGFTDGAGQILIFPNPASEEIILSLTDFKIIPEKAIITSADGVLVKEVGLISSFQAIPLIDLRPGVYLLQLPGIKGVKRFVKI